MAKRKPTPKSDPPSLITTHAELARAVGVERSTITKRLKREDSPVSAAGPWDADDVASLVDWIHDPEGSEGGDDLKRAQALKARVLAAKYLQQMAAELGRLGNAESELLFRAMPSATTVHWQTTRHGLGDLLNEIGNLGPVESDQRAEVFARGFYDSWAKELTHSIEFHAADRDDLAPIVRRIRRLASELRVMPDIDPELITEIETPLNALGVD